MQNLQSHDSRIAPWTRQGDIARNRISDRDTVFQIFEYSRQDPSARPLVIGSVGKHAAQTLVSRLATQESEHFYRISAFQCAELPGMDR